MLSNDNLIISFLKENDYYLNKEDYELQLLSHPDYPSFRSISDTLDYFNIENVALQVPQRALEELPSVFLSLLKIEGKDMLCVVNVKGNMIRVTTSVSVIVMNTKSFKEKWTGIVLVVEKNKANINDKIDNKNILYLTLLVALFSAFISFNQFSIYTLSFLLTTCIGLTLSLALLRDDTGYVSLITEKICGQSDAKSNCSKVTASKQSKLFGHISLIDTVSAFFTTQFLMITLVGFNPTVFLLFVLLAFPAVFYSLYSQYFILKSWCKLCLIITFLVFVQAILLYTGFSPIFNKIDFVSLTSFLSILCFSYLVINLLHDKSKKIVTLKEKELAFQKFRHNSKLFNIALNERALYEPIEVIKKDVVSFGTDNPIIEITAVTNPLCGFCVDSFNTYDNLLARYGDRLQIHFVFSVPFEDQNHPTTKIVNSILNVYKNDRELAFIMLKQWYNKRDINEWERKYGHHGNFTMETGRILFQHREWCVANEINYTPATVIINNFYPKMYSIDELSFFMEDIFTKSKMTVA